MIDTGYEPALVPSPSTVNVHESPITKLVTVAVAVCDFPSYTLPVKPDHETVISFLAIL